MISDEDFFVKSWHSASRLASRPLLLGGKKSLFKEGRAELVSECNIYK
jgi:hypothetical protein